VYSLGINTAPSGDFITFNETGIYEPNDDEDHAFLIENRDSIMAYLHGGSRADIDYYRINMGNEVPVIKQVQLVTYAFLENGENWYGIVNPGESAYLDFVVKNNTDESRSVTVSLSAEGANAGYVTINKKSASTPSIRPNYYASLTSSTDSETGNAGLFVTGRVNEAFKISVDSVFPAGVSIPFVLSFTDSLGISWTETVSLAVSLPSSSLSLEKSLNWISGNAVEGGLYTITINKDETISPRTLSYNGKNVGIILEGGASERTVSLSANGSMFTVGSGVTLTLGSNVTLRGRSSNTTSLVKVNSGGALVMNGGEISGNTASYSYASSSGGGGVYVGRGTFTMNGGKISGNTVSDSYSDSSFSGGGGVYVASGTFTMSGGEISGNTASCGGGVSIHNSGRFTMSYGKISGNTTSHSGGGVNIHNGGRFTMNGGEISGNTVSNHHDGTGGGVNMLSIEGTFESTFTMNGGEISGNTSSGSGGGVYINGACTFTMSGGEISGNTAFDGSGGGVVVGSKSTFMMTGGEISGNTTSHSGGGVDVSGTFTKSGNSTIYGSNASADLKNTAENGHAVYVSSSKKRNTTAGAGVNMDSSKSGAAGGWE
jgi:hypothetical protein